MDKPVRLVRKGPAVRPGGGDDPRGEGSVVNFQDFHSLSIASAASMDNVRRTLLASVYPESAQEVESEGVKAYKVPDSLSRDFWTRKLMRWINESKQHICSQLRATQLSVFVI